MTTTTTEIQTLDLEGLRRKILRVSHSFNSVRVFDHAMNTFLKFLSPRTLKDALQNDPYRTLDSFLTWMDEREYRHQTQVTYCKYVKRFYAHHGVYLQREIVKEQINLPRSQIFEDKALTEDTARKIILECKNTALRSLLTISKDTLARPEEILSLRLEHFNLSHDPPFLSIPAYAAKNDMPREAFFTQETKEFLIAHLKKRDIKDPSQYIFLEDDDHDPIVDEERFQKTVRELYRNMHRSWTCLFKDASLYELRQSIEQRSRSVRYNIHIYSFKKYGFTKIADTLGELAAHAIAGHRSYLITYYKKTREERAEDYHKVAMKLELFQREDHDKEKIKQEISSALDYLPEERLAKVLETARSLLKG